MGALQQEIRRRLDRELIITAPDAQDRLLSATRRIYEIVETAVGSDLATRLMLAFDAADAEVCTAQIETTLALADQLGVPPLSLFKAENSCWRPPELPAGPLVA